MLYISRLISIIFRPFKDPERILRKATENSIFIITGPDQMQRQCGAELLQNGAFKEEFSRFLLEEWQKPQYGPIIREKSVFVSHGGRCLLFQNDINGVLLT